MIEDQRIYYPSIRQSWGIAGITILSTLVFSPVNLMLNKAVGKEITFLVYYLLAMGVPFAIVHFIRNKRTGVNNYNFSLSSIKVMGLVLLATVGLQTGITSPIVNLIPMPEFVQKIFLEFADQKGIYAFLAIVIAAPIIEELIFRGIILEGLLQRYSPVKSIILSSILFGIVHLNPWQFVSALVIGLFSGWVYYRTRKLSLSILIHLANNLFAFIGTYSMDAETMMNKSQLELYGGLINFISITAGAILISIISIFFLRKEFGNSVK
ncbi:CPBP family intramembrane glutamic endopeptidase [Parapedobacter sp. 10938]|uniref:CPBP family intramembrane glutamic endopeptidase n=1 Tax=Parapedobacter flavus TaxID=3110225 RepID=UPI002DBED59B|nr:type II CAAX endopeptidase family protein [Parapedobacter sp. 10938]MEC3879438.1 type II CAAX endopeptidase family protein [Parapedobacter sp. 10938]